MVDIKLLKTFVAVYEERSISAAAARLSSTQPGASGHISLLESQFGVSLFERLPRGVTPTTAGERLYAHALELLRAQANILHEMQSMAGTVIGSITAGFPSSVAHGVLAPILKRFTESHPDVPVVISEGLSSRLCDMVKSRELDFAIIAHQQSDAGLKLTHIYRDRCVMLSSTALAGVHDQPVRLNEPPGYKLIIPAVPDGIWTPLDEPVSTGRIIPARVMNIEGLSGALELVATSDWCTLLPFSAAYKYCVPESRLRLHELAGEPIITHFYLAQLATERLSPASEDFISLIGSAFALVERSWQRWLTEFKGHAF